MNISPDILEQYLEQIPCGAYIDNQYAECGTPKSEEYCPLAKALRWKYGGRWEVTHQIRHNDDIYELGEVLMYFTVLVDAFRNHHDNKWYGDVRVWHARHMLKQAKAIAAGELNLQQCVRQWEAF